MSGSEKLKTDPIAPPEKQEIKKTPGLKGALKAVTRAQGDNVSFVKVGNFERERLEYEVVRIDALYFYAACADSNLTRYHERYLKAKALLQYLESTTEQSADQSKVSAKIAKQKETVKALYRQYRHMSRAARHYMHYRMYETVIELTSEAVVKSPQRVKQLEKILADYYARFNGTGFNFYLRKVSELASLKVEHYKQDAFGPASDPFVLYNPITQEALNPHEEAQSLPLDFMDPGLKLFNHKKNLAAYIQHFDDVHHNVALPVEARIQLWHLNDHQAANAIKDAEKWKDDEYHPTEKKTPFSDEDEAITEEQDCSYEVTDSTAPELGNQFVELERPVSPTQKWVGRIGLALNFGFTLVGMIGVFAGLSMMIPLWPAAVATGILLVIDLLRNKDDFYDQVLRWAKQYETSHPYKTGFHYKGLMQTTGKRALVSMMLRALVGLEFFAVAVPGGMGLVENGKGVVSRLFGQLKKNNTWYQLINPLFYLVAIGCVMISFAVPATAWTDYWGLHATEVKPEHRYNHERTLLQLQHSAGYQELLNHETISEAAEAQDANEFHFEASEVEDTDKLGELAVCPMAFKYGSKKAEISITMDKRDIEFEATRRPRLAV